MRKRATPLPCRFQIGDVVSLCWDKSVKEKHRMLVEVAGITFTDMGIFYDVWVLGSEGELLGEGPMCMVDGQFIFKLEPAAVH